jgi:hypothetical protein
MAQRRKTIGVSNRETFDEEAREGAERDLQLSNKAGIRSHAQKEAGTRHTEDAAPSTHKVAGAFGKEERATDRE